jgi:hypothetical protein
LRYIFSVLKKKASRYQKLNKGIRTTALRRAGSNALSAKARIMAMIDTAHPFSKNELFAILVMQA